MENAVAAYRVASEANDIDALMDTLAPEVEVVSPISGRMRFRGREDVRVLLTAVYGGLDGLRWSEQLGEGASSVVIGEAKVAGVTLGDAMACELGSDGRIVRIRPHIRPWLALTLLAITLGPRLAGHPGVIMRALRAR
jgi:hypothetical protein